MKWLMQHYPLTSLVLLTYIALVVTLNFVGIVKL
jgi:hypothetical protein